MWGFAIWLIVHSIVPVDLGERAVGINLVVIDIAEVLAADDLAAADGFFALTDRVFAVHNVVVPAVAPGLQPLSLHCLILIVGRADPLVLRFAVLVATRTSILECFG